MSKEALAHKVVCLDCALNVIAMNPYCYTHEHVLWSLSDTSTNAQ